MQILPSECSDSNEIAWAKVAEVIDGKPDHVEMIHVGAVGTRHQRRN
jgi:hypothetical protein